MMAAVQSRIARRGKTRRSSRATSSTPARKWSREVTERSDALDLEAGVFTRTPKEIARSLKRSADRSRRRKASPFRSAMSMLNFFENRAGKNLPAARKDALRAAKVELRKLYGRDGGHAAPGSRARKA
jgi:hypothetical protein